MCWESRRGPSLETRVFERLEGGCRRIFTALTIDENELETKIDEMALVMMMTSSSH